VSAGARRRGAAFVRLALLLALSGALSGCLGTAYGLAYHSASGAGDHAAEVAAAWTGPGGELALELVELEGVWGRREATLVLTPRELEQAFAAPLTASAKALPVPHVRLPRAALARGLAPPPRPAEGAPERVRVAEWTPSAEERRGERPLALPAPDAGERFRVSWLHGYRPGLPGETGFALLVARAGPGGVERALFVPEPAAIPLWVHGLWWATLAVDVALIVLVLA
jgi:hypothetical protein